MCVGVALALSELPVDVVDHHGLQRRIHAKAAAQKPAPRNRAIRYDLRRPPQLEPADFAARLGILRQIAKRHEMNVPDGVLTWLASQLDGDARHLAGALNRLRAASEAHEEAIELDFAQSSLADLIHASRRPVRVPDIVEAVCDVMGVASSDLQSSSKTSSVTLPRMLVMFLARKWTRAALSEISRTVGNRVGLDDSIRTGSSSGVYGAVAITWTRAPHATRPATLRAATLPPPTTRQARPSTTR